MIRLASWEIYCNVQSFTLSFLDTIVRKKKILLLCNGKNFLNSYLFLLLFCRGGALEAVLVKRKGSQHGAGEQNQ